MSNRLITAQKPAVKTTQILCPLWGSGKHLFLLPEIPAAFALNLAGSRSHNLTDHAQVRGRWSQVTRGFGC